VARPVRYQIQFAADLAAHVEWLRRHRPAEQRVNLRRALATFKRRVGEFAGLGREIERHGSVAYCVRPVGEHVPYLVWYSYGTADQDGPVSLLMLLHEAQDRERFNPDRFER
jgi:plasmid stabilization system protein ParE